jgi:hypothetical protein
VHSTGAKLLKEKRIGQIEEKILVFGRGNQNNLKMLCGVRWNDRFAEAFDSASLKTMDEDKASASSLNGHSRAMIKPDLLFRTALFSLRFS